MSSQKSSVFVTFLIKQKSKSPSAASRGKPSAAEKQPVQKPPRPAGTPPMEGNCNRSLAIATLLA